MSQSGHGMRLPSGKMIRPRVVTAIQQQLDKCDEALRVVSKAEKTVERARAIIESDPPPAEDEDEDDEE